MCVSIFNDYSIPPEAVGRPLTLVASDTTVRLLDGTVEVARHPRSYDRQKQVLDPAHQEAVLKAKRKAFHATPAGRLEQAAPESRTLLDRQTAQLMKLLDEHGPAAFRRAIVEALELNTPRACSVAFPAPPPVAPATRGAGSQCTSAGAIDRCAASELETYDELARSQDDDAEQQ